MANTEVVAKLEGQLGHLIAKFNIIEEEEFQSHEMWREQDMIDKHAKATTFGSEEVVKETVNELSLEYHILEVQMEKGETTEISFPNSSSLAAEPFILDNLSSMPSSYNHPPQESLVKHFPTAHFNDLEERMNQLMAAKHAHNQLSHAHAPHQSCSYCHHPSHRIDDCPFLNHYVTEVNKSAHENAQTTTILVSEEKAVKKVEENQEQIEPPPTPNLSNAKEVSTEAHSFVTIPIETHHETQVSFCHCLMALTYAIIKDLCTECHKSRNNLPKKIWLSKKIGYLRWQNILPKRYQILKKKGWKGLVGQPYEWGRCCEIIYLN